MMASARARGLRRKPEPTDGAGGTSEATTWGVPGLVGKEACVSLYLERARP